MKSLVYKEKRLTLDDLPIPSVGCGEALIKVSIAGICNTDIEICKGYMNFSGVLGHEFVGVVEYSEDKSLIGKRVVGEINCPCFQCEVCKSGKTNHCPNRTVLGIYKRDGVFAEYTTLPIGNLHIVPESVPDEVAVFTEPVAACFRITEQIQLKPTDIVVVLGDGKMGQLVAQVISPMVYKLVCVGKHDKKIDLLRSAGIESYKIGECSLSYKADVVVDVTGSDNGLQLALDIVKPQGTVVLKSTVADFFKVNLSKAVVDEINIIGSRCGPFLPAIKALTNDKVKVRHLITSIYNISDGLKAFEKALEKDSLKVLIKFD